MHLRFLCSASERNAREGSYSLIHKRPRTHTEDYPRRLSGFGGVIAGRRWNKGEYYTFREDAGAGLLGPISAVVRLLPCNYEGLASLSDLVGWANLFGKYLLIYTPAIK